MKKFILSFMFSLWSIILLAQGSPFPYPATTPGDADYQIVSAGGGISGLDYTGSTWAWLPRCDNFAATFNFNFPNRDPGGNSPTRMKFEVYEQNWITGAFTTVYSSPSWWGFPASTSSTLYFPMAPNGISINVKPFHLYYIKVKAQRQNQIFGIVFWNPLSQRSGFTQTVNIGPCTNTCRSYPGFGWVLGNLNSSPANQAAGLYDPLYETDNFIESTTHLNPNERLILDAGDYVKLLPGFKAEYGSDFIAYIDGCGGRTSKIVDPNVEDDLSDELKSIDNLSVNVYPNPNNGQFTVDFSDEEIKQHTSINILNLMGEIVYTKTVNSSIIQIDINDQPKGIYLVQIISNSKSTVKKVIIK